MSHKVWFDQGNRKAVCAGTGLVALDAVLNGKPDALAKLSTGGSCGNVLIILSYLGWDTYPIARIGNDPAGEQILHDLARWHVKCGLISRHNFDSTPIVIERIVMSKRDTVTHRFELTCPYCGNRLPSYKSVLTKEIQQIASIAPGVQVFYFDRVRRSSVELAKVYKDRGALVVFEPSSIKSSSLFSECLQVADILKYAKERLNNLDALTQGSNLTLEIETLGSQGLNYRFYHKRKAGKWNSLPAYHVKDLRDAAGSGDWCSAGMIHLLGREGKSGFMEATAQNIKEALKFGQALASLNCYFEGARGSMYNLQPDELSMLVDKIRSGRSLTSVRDEFPELVWLDFKRICPSCEKSLF